jgi:hypothetical protein
MSIRIANRLKAMNAGWTTGGISMNGVELIKKMEAERKAKEEAEKPSPEEIREAIEIGVDAAITEILQPYLNGAPIGVVADVLLDRCDTLLSSDQFNRFVDSIARGTQIMSERYEARGFSREQAVQLMCATLASNKKK